MTKVQIRFALAHPLGEEQMGAIALAHGVYGILRVNLEYSTDQVVVEYDASRLSARDVEAALIRCGIPLQPQVA